MNRTTKWPSKGHMPARRLKLSTIKAFNGCVSIPATRNRNHIRHLWKLTKQAFIVRIDDVPLKAVERNLDAVISLEQLVDAIQIIRGWGINFLDKSHLFIRSKRRLNFGNKTIFQYISDYTMYLHNTFCKKRKARYWKIEIDDEGTRNSFQFDFCFSF